MMKMSKAAKIFAYISFVFAFCFLAIGYAAVQDTLLVEGNISVDGYILKYDFSSADTAGYTVLDDGTLKIEEMYYDPDAVNPNNGRSGVNYRVVGIKDNGFKGYNEKQVLYLDLPDSVKKIGENAFSDIGMLSYVSFGEGFTEIRSTSFADCPYLDLNNEQCRNIPTGALVVCNGLGVDISYSESDSSTYLVEWDEAYGSERPIVVSYTENSVKTHNFQTFEQNEHKFEKNRKYVELLPTTQYTYATLDADNGLHIKNRYGYILSDSNQLLEADGTYELGDNGVVYELPTKDGASIAILENSTVPTGARTDGWDTIRDGGNAAFEKTITSVVVADPIKLQGDLRNLFYHCEALQTADLRNADFSQVTSLYEFFDGCSSLTNVWFDENGSTNNVTNMSKMFSLCTSLTSENMDKNLSGLSTDNVTTMEAMFIGCKGLTELTIPAWNFNKVTSIKSMFADCGSLVSVTFEGDLVSESLKDMSYMFGNRENMDTWICGKLETVTFKGKIDTPNLDSMSSMFVYCKSLKSVTFGGDVLTPKLTNMSSLFRWCENLTTITFTGSFDTSNVTDMGSMFNNCKALTSVDLSKFNTPNLKYMNSMFSYSAIREVDLSTFTFDKVENMSYMFQSCSGLTSVKWNPTGTSHLGNVAGMFQSCGKLSTLDMSGFTGTLTTMNNMFDGCKALSGALDLSGFDTHSVTNMDRLFWDCQNITTIYVSENFVVSDGTSTGFMFAQCYNLKGGNGTPYNVANDYKAYARIDGMNGQRGYFTAKEGITVTYATTKVESAADFAFTYDFTIDKQEYFFLNEANSMTLTPTGDTELPTYVTLTYGELTETVEVSTEGVFIIPATFAIDGATITISVATE